MVVCGNTFSDGIELALNMLISDFPTDDFEPDLFSYLVEVSFPLILKVDFIDFFLTAL